MNYILNKNIKSNKNIKNTKISKTFIYFFVALTLLFFTLSEQTFCMQNNKKTEIKHGKHQKNKDFKKSSNQKTDRQELKKIIAEEMHTQRELTLEDEKEKIRLTEETERDEKTLAELEKEEIDKNSYELALEIKNNQKEQNNIINESSIQNSCPNMCIETGIKAEEKYFESEAGMTVIREFEPIESEDEGQDSE